MRRAVLEILLIVAAVTVGFLSFRAAEAGYYNPHLASYESKEIIVASIKRTMVIQAAIATTATWLALRLSLGLLIAWRNRRFQSLSIRHSAIVLLALPTMVIAVIAAGHGDEYQLHDQRLRLGYYISLIGSALLAWSKAKSTDSRQGSWSDFGPGGVRAFYVAAFAVALAYPTVASSRAIGSTPAEVRLSEAVIAAARSGHTHMRLSDYLPTTHGYACLITDEFQRHRIRDSIGIDYKGPLVSGSDTYQIAVVNQDGNGYTMRFMAGRIAPEPGDPMCVKVDSAQLQLEVQRPKEEMRTIVVRWRQQE